MSQLQSLPCEPLHLHDGQGDLDLHIGQLEEGETGTPWQLESLQGVRVLPITWCVTWLGGAECGGQHSCLPHTEGRREDLSLRSGEPAEPGTLVKI